jgi:hypothetical protein
MARYTITTTADIYIDIPEQLTEDEFNHFVDKAVANLDNGLGSQISLDRRDWELPHDDYKFKLPENMDPTKPIWVDLGEHGEWASTNWLVIKKGFDLLPSFEMKQPWNSYSERLVSAMKKTLPNQSDLTKMKPHEGHFLPWTYPMMDQGYKALCLGNEHSIAWIIKDNEIVMGIMPCDVMRKDAGAPAKQWPQPD